MKKYRIDKDKNIGNVIFVVEGGRSETGGTELRLLKKIFADILGYKVQELRRGSDEFIGHGKNPKFSVFALNLPKNQLTQLTEESLDALFRRLNKELNIKPEDCPIFYLYDRDVLSYGVNELRSKYVKKYTDPYGTETGDQGQLLLSYPSVESFLLSCFKDRTYDLSFKLGKDLKRAVIENLLISNKGNNGDNIETSVNMIDLIFADNDPGKNIIHSINEMDDALKEMGIIEYDLDNLSSTLLNVYDYQQQKYKSENAFSLLSLIGMALLELGVIVEID